MNSKKLTINELNQILITELYKSYRDKPEAFIDGKSFFEYIQRNFKEYSINENDFIISLESLSSKNIINQGITTAGGIPKYIKVKPAIINYYEDDHSRTQYPSFSLNFKNNKFDLIDRESYIQINFKDYNLPEFNSVRNLINKCAYDNDLYRLLPFLFRLLLEKLLYQIYLKSIENTQKFLYFAHMPRPFSQLISLFNILKDNEFKQYHTGSINQDIITILKEIQKKGNLSVHQVIRQIDKEFRDRSREKVERTIENLLVLYRNLPKNSIRINDKDRIKKIEKVLGITYP